MKEMWQKLIKPLQLAMLTLSAVFLMSCASPKEIIRVIPADRMVRELPNGNYEVTPAWLKDRYEYERWLKEELQRCKGK